MGNYLYKPYRVSLCFCGVNKYLRPEIKTTTPLTKRIHGSICFIAAGIMTYWNGALIRYNAKAIQIIPTKAITPFAILRRNKHHI